jgi:hypothetical protein
MRPRTPALLAAALLLAAKLDAAPLPGLSRLGPATAVAGSAGRSEALKGGNGYEMGWELRFAPRRFRLFPRWLPAATPDAGFLASSRGIHYAYAGFRFEIPLGRRWMISPGTAAGLYDFGRGRGKRLGSPLQFRTGLELAYRLRTGDRIGLCLYHLSNAGLAHGNPGTESLVLTWTAALRPPR